MLRRHSVSILLGALATRRTEAAGSLDRFFESALGTALLVDVPTRRLIAGAGVDAGTSRLLPPGSTLKPFVLAALLKLGRVRASDSFLCPGRLRIGGRTLDCSHPSLVTPMQTDTALAYSCNCFVAHVAERFAPGELAAALVQAGFSAERIRIASGVDGQRLQALGEDGTLITVEELAQAYRKLALDAAEPIRAGLEGAVEYGTGQHARQANVKVAGKTGSARTAKGDFVAWFAGFLPSRSPEVAIAVMLRGRSGGGDAAPVAGRIFEAYRAGRL